jgi:hypothetical protein
MELKLNFAISNGQTSLYAFTDSDWGGVTGGHRTRVESRELMVGYGLGIRGRSGLYRRMT